MIVKNEAAFLEGCLSSLDGHVNEIVIVDTGSTDETMDIARRFDCKLLQEPWQNNFSKARNVALDNASSDWALYIDADERLVCEAEASLASLLPGDEATGVRLKLRPRTDMTCYEELRLFRCDERIRFIGSMHESIIPSVKAVCTSDNTAIVPRYNIGIEHLGYDGDQAHKHERNIPLLQEAVKQHPERVFLRYDLGYRLSAVGRVEEAELHLLKGMELAGLPGCDEQAQREGSMCAQVLCENALSADDLETTLRHVIAGLQLFEDNLVLQYCKAGVLARQQKLDAAIDLLEPLATIDPDTFFDHRLAYAKSIFAEDVPGLLGSVYLKTGQFERAANYFSKALQASPDNLEYKAKLAICQTRS